MAAEVQIGDEHWNGNRNMEDGERRVEHTPNIPLFNVTTNFFTPLIQSITCLQSSDRHVRFLYFVNKSADKRWNRARMFYPTQDRTRLGRWVFWKVMINYAGHDDVACCCKDDLHSVWERANFGTPPARNPSTDRHHIWYTWLYVKQNLDAIRPGVPSPYIRENTPSVFLASFPVASPVAVLRSSPPKLGVQWSEALAIFQAAHIRSLHQSMKLLNVKISSRIISLQCKQISDSQAFRSTQRSNFKPYSWWQISLHRDNRERKAQNWRCNCNPCSKV